MIMRLLIFFKLSIKCPYLIGELFNHLNFFLQLFIRKLIFEQFKNGVFVWVSNQDFADFLFGLIMQRWLLVVYGLEVILDFVDGGDQVLHS
jgi:hypothetical protein